MLAGTISGSVGATGKKNEGENSAMAREVGC